MRKNEMVILILLLGLFVRIILSFFGTLHLDQGTFIAWSSNLVNDGFKSFYSGWSDYLPGYPYFLWLLGKIDLLHIIPQVMLYKLPAIFADLVTGYLIYKILKESKGVKWGVLGAAVYIFNPAILANSTFWGQVDSLTALSSILAIYLLPKMYLLSAVVLAIGTLIKPQVAFAFPAILFLFIKEKWDLSKIFKYIFTGLTVFILGFLPFANGNLFKFIFERLSLSANQYPYTSINAFNFWGLTGFWQPDNIYFQLGGYLFVTIVAAFLIPKLIKNKNSAYYFLTFIFAASFTYFTRIHERHLLPVFAPLAIVAIENPIFLIPYVGFSLTYIVNLNYSFIWITEDFKRIFSDFFTKSLSLLNVSFVVSIFYLIIKNIKLDWNKLSLLVKRFIDSWKKRETSVKQISLSKISLNASKAKLILIIILIFAFVTRVFNLNSPKSEYFDEVYHAFTAKVILHGGVEAWEWWNTPPEGFAYEWTHPPLAKLIMALSMRTFGVKANQIEEDIITKFNYTVLDGENLWDIARKTYGNGMRFTDIAKQNNLRDPRKIYPNQILILEKLEKYIKTETIFLGENSFGYRIPGALLGVGSVFLIYLLSKKIFKDEMIGLLSAGVFSLDGLPLVMSRIAMNDSYLLFFSLLSIYMFVKKKDFWSALSFGLALSSKWSALWTLPILFIIWLKQKDKLRLSLFVSFLFLPIAIYLLSYLPMFTTGHDLNIWWGMQKQMWWYHTGLVATHAYSSPWWNWPLLIRPIYLYTSDEIGGMVTRIYTMGNPFVFWFGIISVILSSVYSFIEKNKNLGLVVFCYLMFFVPWAASPRIMFLYHYLPAVPFMCIAIGYVLRRNLKLIFPYLLICLLGFIYFYPHWAGLQIPLWLDKSYYWISSWR